jgi:hypothetical protein
MGNKKRKTDTKRFKLDTVKLVEEESLSGAELARDLGVGSPKSAFKSLIKSSQVRIFTVEVSELFENPAPIPITIGTLDLQTEFLFTSLLNDLAIRY